jgi:hypothetical protein
MAYIKISDPKIIDLPTIHQIINVVNQHSDNISAITNNFGSIYSGTNTSGATTQSQFDISSQQIMYGQTAISKAKGAVADLTTYWKYTQAVNITVPFTGVPYIIAQVSTDYTGVVNYQDLIVNVANVTQNSFNLVLRHAALNKVDWLAANTVYVNWIALGHK